MGLPSVYRWTLAGIVNHLCEIAANAWMQADRGLVIVSRDNGINWYELNSIATSHKRMAKFIEYLRVNYGSLVGPYASSQFEALKGSGYSIGPDAISARDACIASFDQAKSMFDAVTSSGGTLSRATAGDTDTDPGVEYYLWVRSSQQAPTYGEINDTALDALVTAWTNIKTTIDDPQAGPLPTIA